VSRMIAAMKAVDPNIKVGLPTRTMYQNGVANGNFAPYGIDFQAILFSHLNYSIDWLAVHNAYQVLGSGSFTDNEVGLSFTLTIFHPSLTSICCVLFGCLVLVRDDGRGQSERHSCAGSGCHAPTAACVVPGHRQSRSAVCDHRYVTPSALVVFVVLCALIASFSSLCLLTNAEYNSLMKAADVYSWATAYVAAFYTADLLFTLAERTDVWGAMHWSATGNGAFGAVFEYGGVNYRRPTFYALSELSRVWNGTMVNASVTSPTFSTVRYRALLFFAESFLVCKRIINCFFVSV
jgi:hypothetical protein